MVVNIIDKNGRVLPFVSGLITSFSDVFGEICARLKRCRRDSTIGFDGTSFVLNDENCNMVARIYPS